MSNEVLGAKSFLCLAMESTWGTEGDEYVYTPVSQYGVEYQPETRQSRPYLGLMQEKYSKNFRGMPSGQLVTELFGYEPTPLSGTTSSDLGISLAEYLLDWGMVDEAGTIHEAVELPSMSAEWAEGPDVTNMEHLGLRVNQATLAGQDGGPLQLTYDLMGKSEAAVGSARTIPTDHEEIASTAFEFCDTVFNLNDGAGGANEALPIESLQLQVNHGLQVKYNNESAPSLILATRRTVTLQVTIDKDASLHDVDRRGLGVTNFTGELIIQGLNNGTGAAAWTIGTITFPKLVYVNHQDQRNRDAIVTQPLQFHVQKPDSSSLDMSIAWTTGASKDS